MRGGGSRTLHPHPRLLFHLPSVIRLRTQDVDDVGDCSAPAVIHLLVTLLATAITTAPGLPTAKGAMGVILGALPSQRHSGQPTRSWVRFQAELLGHLVSELHARYAADESAEPIGEAQLGALAWLFGRVVMMQSWLSSALEVPASMMAAGSVTPLPHGRHLQLLTLLVERCVADRASSDGHTLLRTVGAHSAAAVSHLVSWVRSSAAAHASGPAPPASPRARSTSLVLDGKSKATLELHEAALRLLLLRFDEV